MNVVLLMVSVTTPGLVAAVGPPVLTAVLGCAISTDTFLVAPVSEVLSATAPSPVFCLSPSFSLMLSGIMLSKSLLEMGPADGGRVALAGTSQL